MTWIVAIRSLLTHPVRSAVLACGFGLGVSVMASLLGIGEVILQQARAPALAGGGDVVIFGPGEDVPNARFVVASVLGGPPVGNRVAVASPTRRENLYVLDNERVLPIRARAGIPSLERALGDPETSGAAAWIDTRADAAWLKPSPRELLQAVDRFHPIPDVPARASSWAEWLYFNGRSGSTRFYLTFLVGPKLENGRRTAHVRLQLDRGGDESSFAYSEEVDDAEVLRDAPELSIGPNRVGLDGSRYRIHLELSQADGGADAHVTADISLDASLARALPPLEMAGAGGWVMGYTVPVMSGALGGELSLNGVRLPLDGGIGYHDHNWGFWEGVTWQWGQVDHEGLAFIYGRVRPPADAADPARVPGLIIAFGPDGPIGYATNVAIDEHDAPGTGSPARIVIRGSGRALDLTMELDVEKVVVSRLDRLGMGQGHRFFQLRAHYSVRGQVGERRLEFTAPGSAETFRAVTPPGVPRDP